MTLRLNNYTIKSKKHELYTVITNKNALSPFDGKRYFPFDAVSTLHCKVSEDIFFFEIIDNSLKETESEIRTQSYSLSIEKSLLDYEKRDQP